MKGKSKEEEKVSINLVLSEKEKCRKVSGRKDEKYNGRTEWGMK